MNNTYTWVVHQLGDYLKGKVLTDKHYGFEMEYE